MQIPQIVKLMGALIVGLAFASLIPLKAFAAPAAAPAAIEAPAAIR